mmetsp:Transcript_142605/g.362093  ORF Transcript_142605/g.362093 Transcript_142605/m.362093 type:complete len:314 (+) Transcript_142605:730-1671(+)
MLPQLRQSLLLLQSRAQGGYCVLLAIELEGRRVPPSHDLIADELADDTPVLHHDVAHVSEVFPEHLHEHLRAQALSHCSKASNVAEEDRDICLGHAQHSSPLFVHKCLYQVRVHVPGEGLESDGHVREGVADVFNLADLSVAIAPLAFQDLVYEVVVEVGHSPHVGLQSPKRSGHSPSDQCHQECAKKDERSGEREGKTDCVIQTLLVLFQLPVDHILDRACVRAERLRVDDDPINLIDAVAAAKPKGRVDVFTHLVYNNHVIGVPSEGPVQDVVLLNQVPRGIHNEFVPCHVPEELLGKELAQTVLRKVMTH